MLKKRERKIKQNKKTKLKLPLTLPVLVNEIKKLYEKIERCVHLLNKFIFYLLFISFCFTSIAITNKKKSSIINTVHL